MAEGFNELSDLHFLIQRLILQFLLTGGTAIALRVKSRLIDIEIDDFEVLHILEVLLLHDGQHLRNVLLGSPHEHHSLAHQSRRLQSDLLEVLQGLTLLAPLNVDEDSQQVFGQGREVLSGDAACDDCVGKLFDGDFFLFGQIVDGDWRHLQLIAPFQQGFHLVDVGLFAAWRKRYLRRAWRWPSE